MYMYSNRNRKYGIIIEVLYFIYVKAHGRFWMPLSLLRRRTVNSIEICTRTKKCTKLSCYIYAM